MNKMAVRGLFILIISCVSFMACQGGGKSQRNANSAVKVEDEKKDGVKDREIPYIVADRYFVKNAVESVENPKITTQAEFDKIFGTAAVMGKGGLPTTIDFSKQYVIAVVKPETDFNTKLIPLGLQKNEKGKIIFSYKVENGEKQTYTTVPCLVIVVNNTFPGDVVLEEVY